MPCIQVGVRIPPHLHKKLAIEAAKAEASKSEVIINAFPDYLKFPEDMPNPDWNPPIEVIRGRTSHHLWHQTSQTIYISTLQRLSPV
ncbi:MAG: toxin-antitoxin system HicB family antitoxin [Nostoc sp.]|uniref:toxin-antitoxin system HicB family antitoxin n=1 Tax=Nostoc sp. TaxID=1180 RepID=UPI002FF3B1BD